MKTAKNLIEAQAMVSKIVEDLGCETNVETSAHDGRLIVTVDFGRPVFTIGRFKFQRDYSVAQVSESALTFDLGKLTFAVDLAKSRGTDMREKAGWLQMMIAREGWAYIG